MDMKVYITEEVATDIAYQRDISELPELGRQTLTVPAIASGLPVSILGKDKRGFYTDFLRI